MFSSSFMVIIPQMNPMNWFFLFNLFSLSLVVFFSKLWFKN